MSSDFRIKLDQARARLPLRRLMEQHGMGPSNGNWKRFPACPFCQGKDCAGVNEFNGREYFKCFKTDCPSGTCGDKQSWDEVKFIGHVGGLGGNFKEASIQYLKEAGVWTDRESHAPSVMPGKAARKIDPPLGMDEVMEEEYGMKAPEPTEPVISDQPRKDSGAGSSVISEQTEQTISGDEPVPGGAEEAKPDEGAAPVPPVISSDQSSVISDQSRPPEGGVPPGAANIAGAGGTPALPPGGGGDGPPPGDGVPDKPGDPGAKYGWKAALKYFYDRTELTPADIEMLWIKRGLLESTARMFGNRSSLANYKDLLLSMKDIFPMQALLESFLWKYPAKEGSPGEEDHSKPPVPNAQYYGWGIKGKKKLPGGKTEVEWDWTYPILIPYWNPPEKEGGEPELIYLRPHKGNPRGSIPRLYTGKPGATFTTDGSYDFAVITEGEFKMQALWQGLREPDGSSKAITASVPGINLAKPLYGDVEEWLADRTERKQQVFVAYDEEEKGDPKLPGYKEEEWKRYESQIWSRYLANRIVADGFDARVCTLPKEWRDEKGKADWDGALAMLVRKYGGKPPEGTGLAALCRDAATNEKMAAYVSLQGEIWGKVAARVKRDFLKTLNESQKVKDLAQSGLFESKAEREIRNRLEKISYIPKLPWGGDEEMITSSRLFRLAGKARNDPDRIPSARVGFMQLVAREYTKLGGCYYQFKKLSDKNMDNWASLYAGSKNDIELRRACEVIMKGVPTPVSDFTLEAHYALSHRNKDGRTVIDRIVTIKPVKGLETKMLALPSNMFSQPSKFREWLLDNCKSATWMTGEIPLQSLMSDVGAMVAFKGVEEVGTRGYHRESKLYFFGDVAYTPDGNEIVPNSKNGIYWYSKNGLTEGYRLGELDPSGQEFYQKTPMMHPGRKDPVKKSDQPRKDSGAGSSVISDQSAGLRELFREVAHKFYDTLGDHSAWVFLGMILGAPAGPAIFNKWNMYPGLWVHGAQGEGKSSVMRWGQCLYGFDLESGISIQRSTYPGVESAMAQYGYLPVWLDEYQGNPDRQLTEMLKKFTGHEKRAKMTVQAYIPEVLATPIVSGVATSGDTQLRARYVHVQVSAKKRLAAHFEWFQEHCKDFYVLGRFILRHRKEYADLVVKLLTDWTKSPKTAGMDERAKIVHGTGWAAFAAMSNLLESHDAKEMIEFRDWCVRSGGEAMVETEQGMNVNAFIREMITANLQDAFGVTPGERRKIFRVVEVAGSPGLSPFQVKAGADNPFCAWKSWILYFQPGPVISNLQRSMRSRGKELALDQSDLQAQMKVKPFWVKADTSGWIRKTFEGTQAGCWGIMLDHLDEGLIRVGDEEFRQSFFRPGTQDYLPSDEWEDPRKGDIFSLINSLKSKKED